MVQSEISIFHMVHGQSQRSRISKNVEIIIRHDIVKSMRNVVIILALIFLSFGCAAPQQRVNQPEKTNINAEKAKLYRQMASNIIINRDYRNIPKALKYLDKSEALTPNNPQTAYLKGITYMMEGKFGKSFRWLQKSISINNKLSYVHNAMGIWYAKDSQYEKAIIQFSLAIALSKYSYPVTSYYNRAIAFENIGKYRKALRDLKSVVKLGSYNRKAFFHMANDYFVLGMFEKSIKALENIEARSHLNNYDQMLYAKNLFYLKRYKKSEFYLRKLLNSDNGNIKKQARVYLRLIRKNE